MNIYGKCRDFIFIFESINKKIKMNNNLKNPTLTKSTWNKFFGFVCILCFSGVPRGGNLAGSWDQVACGKLLFLLT